MCDARDGEAASIARAPPPPRARPRGVRSIGGAFVELFTVSFSFQYERVRARWDVRVPIPMALGVSSGCPAAPWSSFWRSTRVVITTTEQA